jgi:hypothetical protein
MSRIQFLSRRNGNSHIVWLQESNKYISLKNPFFDVFRLLAQDCSYDEIYLFLSKKYGLSVEESQYLVAGIDKEIAKINSLQNIKRETNSCSESSNYTFVSYSKHKYKFGEKVFSIAFEDKNLKDWVQQLIGYLEIDNNEIPSLHFEIFNLKGNVVFRESANDINIASKNQTIYFVDNFFWHLSNKLFDKSESDFLMTVHASAITNQQKTILFSASSGGGKTTLAAFLLQKGFFLVSDDLVMLDKQKRAYGFPSAMSIKLGAFETLLSVYPELAEKKEIKLSPNKKVRYLSAIQHKSNTSETHPVHEVIFVQYNPKVNFKLSKLSCIKGIKAFIEQAYIIPDSECAGIFLDWALNTSFYQLTYSDTDLAIKEITKLFHHA